MSVRVERQSTARRTLAAHKAPPRPRGSQLGSGRAPGPAKSPRNYPRRHSVFVFSFEIVVAVAIFLVAEPFHAGRGLEAVEANRGLDRARGYSRPWASPMA